MKKITLETILEIIILRIAIILRIIVETKTKIAKILKDQAKIVIIVITENNKFLKKELLNIPFFDEDDFHNLF